VRDTGPFKVFRSSFFLSGRPETFPPKVWRSRKKREGARVFRGLLLLATLGIGAGSTHAQTTTLQATPSVVSLGTVPVGSSVTQSVQIKNNGTQSATISSVNISSSLFTTSGLTLPLTLAAGTTKTFTLKFSPTQTGSDTGTATFKSIRGVTELTIALSGAGTAATRTVTASTARLNFGNETVGRSEKLGVTLKNTGNSSLTLSQLSLTGIDASISSGLTGATIASGQSATLDVTFAPKSAEQMTGSIKITSNASNSPTLIQLSGTGVSSEAHSVALIWEASASSGVIGYNIYRAVSGSGFAKLVSAPVSGLKYTDGTVQSGKTYAYVVTSVTASGKESSYSASVTAVIP
jgi:hypothetical protein